MERPTVVCGSGGFYSITLFIRNSHTAGGGGRDWPWGRDNLPYKRGYGPSSWAR